MSSKILNIVGCEAREYGTLQNSLSLRHTRNLNETIHRLIHALSGMTIPLPPKLKSLPHSLPIEGAVRIELSEGIPVFRASSTVQNRIEELLEKQQNASLNAEEEQELDCYEEIDDYLSFVNRTIRNPIQFS